MLIALGAGGLMGLLHAIFSVSLRSDQIVGGTAINFLALGITSYFFFKLYGSQGTPSDLSTIPDVHLGFLGHGFIGDVFGQLNLMIWIGIALVFVTWLVVFKTPIGLRIRACGEHPRAADTVGIDVYAVRYAAVIVSGILAGAGGAYLSLGLGSAFTENMTAGRGFIALAALIFGRLEAVRRRRRVPAVRLLERARREPAGVLDVDLDALHRAPVPPHARGRRRSHRPHDSPRGRWHSLQEAIAGRTRGRGWRCSSACSRS